MPDSYVVAIELMEEFARSTGLSSDEPARRYLWTDAFAVCNYLGLYAACGEQRFRSLALDLVDQVHRVLGRHRDDDPRSGWISGLSEEEGAQHPTAGGLRIGKPLPERQPDQRYDPRREWDRDGQYYHYLTQWMHALNRAWQVSGDETYHRWAVELAEAAHEGFVERTGGDPRLNWKMSIDLTRPLVPSTGQHDPLSGFITLSSLQAAAPPDSIAGRLGSAISDLWEMCRNGKWATQDPLGAGGLLVDAYRCVGLERTDGTEIRRLLPDLMKDAVASVEVVVRIGAVRGPAERRLAFRELGLSIGLAAAERLIEPPSSAGERSRTASLVADLERLRPHLSLRDEIERFWLDPAHRQVPTWTEHQDISQVMLATSLAAGGYLGAR